MKINKLTPFEKTKKNACRHGRFTLIELLVVVGVIAIMAGMLMPALIAAKARATRTKLINNVSQFHKASLMYYSENEPNQFIINTLSGGELSIDFTLMTVNGFLPDMMEDPFRLEYSITDDPAVQLAINQMSNVTSIDAAAFHPSEKGLLYFNFMSKDSGGNTIVTVTEFNDGFNYAVPDDTQYAIVGVGLNGELDRGQPGQDFVYIKRISNANVEPWPNN